MIFQRSHFWLSSTIKRRINAHTFLACTDDLSLFSVHRNGLITNGKHIRDLADTIFGNEDFRFRLRNTSLISYGTAKSIITILGQVYDCDCQSILHTTYTPLIAAIVLAIHIYKHPTTITARVNLEVSCGQRLRCSHLIPLAASLKCNHLH